MSERNIYLDYIRAVACIIVIMFHYTKRYNEIFHTSNDWKFRVSWGYMAVSIFFVLSGFLAVLKDDTGIKEYIRKRFLRLYPAYWIAVIVTFLVTYFYLPERAVSVKDAVINLTMLESFCGVGLVDGAYWTLAYEIVFYIFIALIIYLFHLKDKLPYLGLAWIALLFIYVYLENSTMFLSSMGDFSKNLIDSLIGKQYGHMFVAGFCAAFIIHHIGDRKSTVTAGICLALSVVLQYVLFGVLYTVFFIAVMMILMLCAYLYLKGIQPNGSIRKVLYPLELIAVISYPLYLLHQNIGYTILKFLQLHISQSEFIIVIPFIINVLLAGLIHILLNKLLGFMT